MAGRRTGLAARSAKMAQPDAEHYQGDAGQARAGQALAEQRHRQRADHERRRPPRDRVDQGEIADP
jgi:hypothetical protein